MSTIVTIAKVCSPHCTGGDAVAVVACVIGVVAVFWTFWHDS